MTRRAVVAMTSTASGGIALLAIAWVATRRLTPAELGFFFSFLSLGSLVQLADFGLSYASLQTGGRLAGTDRLHEMAGVAVRIRRWNLATSSVAVAVTAAIGAMIFSSRQSTMQSGALGWRAPWAAYLLSVFLNQLTLPQMALREGSGRVTQIWRLRLIQEWVAGAACLAALQGGWGLWSLSVFVAVRAALASAWLGLGEPLRHDPGGPGYSLTRWMSDIWPFQWKIGLSGLSGFLIFRAFTPIILLEKGPVLAGQFGLAISIMNLLISVTSAWPISQAASYAALAAESRFSDLRAEFPVMLWSSTALAVAASAAASLALGWARGRGFAFAVRLTEPLTTVLILSTAVVHHIVACFAVVLRAESREPLLIPSVAGGLLTVFAVSLSAHFGGARDIAVTNLACACAGMAVAALLFRSRQNQLRSLAADPARRPA